MTKKADGAVGAGEADLSLRNPARLLIRHVLLKTVDIGLRRLPVEKREGGVPCLGDHPVRAELIRQIMGEGHERIGPLRPLRAVKRPTDTLCVHVPERAVEAPVFVAKTPHEDAHEGQTALMKGAHGGEAHDLLRAA